MREMLNPTSALAGMKLDTTVALHHGRPLLRRSPAAPLSAMSAREVASGGPIGLIEEGDTIEINIPEASIHLAVSDEELARRKAEHVQPEPNVKSGCWPVTPVHGGFRQPGRSDAVNNTL